MARKRGPSMSELVNGSSVFAVAALFVDEIFILKREQRRERGTGWGGLRRVRGWSSGKVRDVALYAKGLARCSLCKHLVVGG